MTSGIRKIDLQEISLNKPIVLYVMHGWRLTYIGLLLVLRLDLYVPRGSAKRWLQNAEISLQVKRFVVYN